MPASHRSVRRRIIAALAVLGLPAAAPAPTRIFIASDSTAQDYAADKYPQSGWGTMLRCALDPSVTVENRAIGGRSTKSFTVEGRLDRIARDIRAGDTLLIQFGHNDANQAKAERYTPVPEYEQRLKQFIGVARNVGAQPVLLTPVTRRVFQNGAVVHSFPTYSDAARRVAAETNTPLIDLASLSERWLAREGDAGSVRYYLHYVGAAGAPGYPQGVDDDTHFSELGARRIADLIAGGLAGLHLPVSRHVLGARPALLRTTPAGGRSCAAPPPGESSATRPMRFGFAPGRVAGATPVLAGHSFDGRFGFEPGDPHLFSVALPEGNYRVTVTLGDRRSAGDTTIKAESRRLMLDAVHTRAGQSVRRSFAVNVRTPALAPVPVNAPGGPAVRLAPDETGSLTWDAKLTLEVLGDHPALGSVEIQPATSIPTLFLLGDSTVTDQRFEPTASWGQMLPAFFGDGLAVANHAHSGETLKSSLTSLRLDKVLASARPGDVAMIQFGHNDQKAAWPQTYAPAESTYRDYLRTYIAELRRRGVTPILVTSPERRRWSGKAISPSLNDYAEAVRAVGAEQKVAVIDLNAASIRFYEALGEQRAPLAFNDGRKDATHHDNYGAWVLARIVAEGVRTSGLPLAGYLRAGLEPFDPAHPPAPETFQLAPSAARSGERPAGS